MFNEFLYWWRAEVPKWARVVIVSCVIGLLLALLNVNISVSIGTKPQESEQETLEVYP